MPDIGDVILWYVVFLFSLTLHEVGHAWTSELFGDSTGRYLGRISLNPLVHIDPIGTVVFPLVGALTGIPLFGWAKPVPVNPLRWRDQVKANIAVSAAGPLANLLITIIALALIKLLIWQGVFELSYNFNLWHFIKATEPSPFFSPLATMLCIAVSTNVGLAVFNMLPIPPLDGSHILASVLSLISQPLLDAYEQVRSYGFMVLMLFLIIDRQLKLLSIIFLPILSFIFLLVGY
ncbi:MAG: site-2 protease family protein [Acidobacteriota bacterium]